jgi:hypothetical protein
MEKFQDVQTPDFYLRVNQYVKELVFLFYTPFSRPVAETGYRRSRVCRTGFTGVTVSCRYGIPMGFY